MTVAQEWVQRGVEQGIQQGIQQGVQQGLERGRLETLIEILEARFGAVDDAMRARLAATETQALRSLIRRAATLDSLNDLFEPPSPH